VHEVRHGNAPREEVLGLVTELADAVGDELEGPPVAGAEQEENASTAMEQRVERAEMLERLGA
jgi:hypothetical protein